MYMRISSIDCGGYCVLTTAHPETGPFPASPLIIAFPRTKSDEFATVEDTMHRSMAYFCIILARCPSVNGVPQIGVVPI
jgi:hypothetical protein